MTIYTHTCPNCGFEYRTENEFAHVVRDGEVTATDLTASCNNDNCEVVKYHDPNPTEYE